MFSLMAASKAAGLISVTGFMALGTYAFHRQGDMVDNYVSMKREQSSIVKALHESNTERQKEISAMERRIMTAMRDKQEACKVLEATVSGNQYTHEYECK